VYYKPWLERVGVDIDHYFQQFFSYIVTARLAGGEQILDSYNKLINKTPILG